jgi:putative ABC transport system permease protein
MVAARNGANTAWFLESWQQIRSDDSFQIRSEQQVLEAGSALLAVIALAGIAVMVGTRMTEQTRRVGLLKAVGATPKTVAVMLLVENLLVAIAAAAVGVLAGRLIAPALTTAGNSLLGSAGTPTLTVGTAAIAIALAAAVAVAATAGPAIKGARTSTIRALANPARPPQRNQRLIDLSNRLPPPLLLAIRTSARRPARTLLAIASITVAVATTVATIALRNTTVLGVKVAGNVLAAAKTQSVNHVAASLTAVLLTVAAINVLFVTWATIIETRRTNALARALGASPRQVTAGLTATLAIAALIAALAGLPAGFVLYAAVGGNPTRANLPVLLFLAIIPITTAAVAVLAAIPARIAALAPVAPSLRSE